MRHRTENRILTNCHRRIELDLTWRREPGGDWLLLNNRRRVGRVVPDSKYPDMWRVHWPGDGYSDLVNLSWAKDALARFAETESRQHRRRQSHLKAPPVRSNQSGVSEAAE